VKRLLCLLALCTGASAAAPPTVEGAYTAWSQGRPAEAADALAEAARRTQRWDVWYDAGLAADEAGRPGHATAYLLRAYRLAPAADAPRHALLARQAALPPSWSDRLGPLSWSARGSGGLLVLAVGALALGLVCSARFPRRKYLLGGASLLLASAIPGLIAAQIDGWHTARLAAILQNSQLLDSTGRSLPDGTLEAGTIVRLEERPPWDDRRLVELADGRRGWLPISATSLDGNGS